MRVPVANIEHHRTSTVSVLVMRIVDMVWGIYFMLGSTSKGPSILNFMVEGLNSQYGYSIRGLVALYLVTWTLCHSGSGGPSDGVEV